MKYSFIFIIFALVNFCAIDNKADSLTVLNMSSCSILSKEPVPTQFVVGEILTQCTSAVKNFKKTIQDILTTPIAKQNFISTLFKYETASTDFNDLTIPLYAAAFGNNDPVVREEAYACGTLYDNLYIEVNANKKLYNIFVGQKAKGESQKQLKRYLLQAFEKNGIQLDENDLKKYTELSSQIEIAKLEYSKNSREDQVFVLFTETELEGLSVEFINNLPTDESGLKKVTANGNDYTSVLSKAKNPNTRRKIMEARSKIGGQKNIDVLARLLRLRAEAAILLNKKNWADYKLSFQMAGSVERVLSFLNSLTPKVKAKYTTEVNELLAIKKSLDSTATSIDIWDINYYTRLLKEKKYNFNSNAIDEYFPTEITTERIMRVFESTLGVKFDLVRGITAWDPSVRLYQVRNELSCEVIGYFYLDLYYRDGKAGGVFEFPFIKGRQISKGYSPPVAALYTDFASALSDKPALMSHGNVISFFHEFGHVMHEVLTRAPYGSLSGTSVLKDFVEGPSQMFENWAWDAKVLKAISGHYLRPAETLPENLLKKMISSRDFQLGSYYIRQLFFAYLDLDLHTTTEAVDPQLRWNKLYKEFTSFEPIPNNYLAANFSYFTNYDSGVYSYLWSDVFAKDMFSEFKKRGLDNRFFGQRYRKKILEPGAMSEPDVLLNNFLNRPFNDKAFLKSLGID